MNDFPTYHDPDFDGEAVYNVYRGAAWLDEVKPGWENLVNLDIFTMCDADVCIAGQVFAGTHGKRGYDYVYDTYGSSFILEHGFVHACHRDTWIEQIVARQIAAELEPV